jgi:hypothetical protein
MFPSDIRLLWGRSSSHARRFMPASVAAFQSVNRFQWFIYRSSDLHILKMQGRKSLTLDEYKR